MPNHSFFTGQPVFAQLLNLIPDHILSKLVVRYQANRYCKSFMTYDHLVTMLYQRFFQCLSLRELISGMQATHLRLKHLDLRTTPGAVHLQMQIQDTLRICLGSCFMSFTDIILLVYRIGASKNDCILSIPPRCPCFPILCVERVLTKMMDVKKGVLTE